MKNKIKDLEEFHKEIVAYALDFLITNWDVDCEVDTDMNEEEVREVINEVKDKLYGKSRV